MSIFDEQYRVIGFEKDRLLVRGVRSGDLLTIVDPTLHLAQERPPLGALIALTDPSTGSMN